ESNLGELHTVGELLDTLEARSGQARPAADRPVEHDRWAGVLGEPPADSTVGRERWLVFEWTDVVLRVRGGAGPEGRITSWTATLQNGRGTLREAAAPFGLWPACAPDEEAGTVQTPLVRRGLPASGTGRARTLTATVREGRITAITLFDEPPDWR
ncbi:MAG: hypothetical protein ACE5JR_08445, partial [Gemmatimonadota bacterium]